MGEALAVAPAPIRVTKTDLCTSVRRCLWGAVILWRRLRAAAVCAYAGSPAQMLELLQQRLFGFLLRAGASGPSASISIHADRPGLPLRRSPPGGALKQTLVGYSSPAGGDTVPFVRAVLRWPRSYFMSSTSRRGRDVIPHAPPKKVSSARRCYEGFHPFGSSLLLRRTRP